VKDVFSVAFPLAFGKAIEEEEFKILTVFASTKGGRTVGNGEFSLGHFGDDIRGDWGGK
jgi:hypothetical protein